MERYLHQLKNISKSVICLFLLILPGILLAHETGQSYLFLKVYDDAIEGRFEFALDDLNSALVLHGKDRISEENLEEHIDVIKAYVQENVKFQAGTVHHPIEYVRHSVRHIEIANYVKYYFRLGGEFQETPPALDIDYRLFFETDNRQNGLVVLEHYWKGDVFDAEANVVLIFNPDNPLQRLDLTSASLWKGFWGVIKMGIWHIWIGFDHILFLIALILPAVMFRNRDEWEPVLSFKPALINVVKIITLFTVAHSITLSIAALGILELPSQLVESIIAISIAVAALDIIFPVFRNRIWIVVFVFGLFHGFGFAGVLGELGVLGENMALSLFGFNLGVEIGQVAIIVVVFPLLYLLRNQTFYKIIFLKTGAAMLILIAFYWFLERAFELDIPFIQW